MVPAIRARFRGFRDRVIASSQESWPADLLPADTRAFLDELWDRYQDFSASQLCRLTHEQSPWRDAYQPGAQHVVIPDAAMRHCFLREIPLEDRIFHENVVVVSAEGLARLDEDEDLIVERAVAALR